LTPVATGFEQPVEVLHVPATWQLSSGWHMTAVPAHVPLPWHVSFWVQAFWSLHELPTLAAHEPVASEQV
jgi:hypothetical protein